MERKQEREARPDRVARSVDYLRQRSQHRLWWDSARIALRRAQRREPFHPPSNLSGTGKRL